MTRATSAVVTLDVLSSVPLPLKTLGHLAAAAGYEARGQRAEAEFYLGLGLAGLPYDLVAPDSVAGLLQTIYRIAAGTAPVRLNR